MCVHRFEWDWIGSCCYNISATAFAQVSRGMNPGQAASTGAIAVAFLEAVVRPLLSPVPVFNCPSAGEPWPECPPCPACEVSCLGPLFPPPAEDVCALNECEANGGEIGWWAVVGSVSSVLNTAYAIGTACSSCRRHGMALVPGGAAARGCCTQDMP